MRIAISMSLLVWCTAVDAAAQVTPSTLSRTGVYSSQQLGVLGGAGGIEFDAAGANLYIIDRRRGQVVGLQVVRNTAGRITGFTSPRVIVASRAAGTLDGGLAFNQVGTMILTNYNPADIEQYSAISKAHTVTRLSTLGVAGNTGAAEFIPAAGSRRERLLVSDYDNGGLFEIPVTLNANLTYTLGRAVPYLRTPSGIDGFEFLPRGPFGQRRGLVVVNYDKQRIDLVAIDPVTDNPFQDAAGNSLLVPVITGLNEPMDVEFDPITGDMFITDYTSASATMLQYSGQIRGGLDGSFDLFGPGCPRQGGAVPTLDTGGNSVRGGFAVTFRLSGAPANQATSFLLLGLGDTGNLGGFRFPGTQCRAYVNHLLMVPMATNAAGVGTLAGTVPTALTGMTLFAQAWAVSPGANPLNLTVSDAAVCLVGR